MRRLIVFNSVTVDGYFTGAGGDMSWAHNEDPEWNAFVEENASGGGVLVFGRVTYEMMASFWPTPFALQSYPLVAKQMNDAEKVVFSRTLDSVSWSNTTLVKGDLTTEVRKLKEAAGDDLVILGSGSIVAQLTDASLIDEYQIVVDPVVLGAGRTMFEGIKNKLKLKRVKTRTFNNGNVLLCYERIA